MADSAAAPAKDESSNKRARGNDGEAVKVRIDMIERSARMAVDSPTLAEIVKVMTNASKEVAWLVQNDENGHDMGQLLAGLQTMLQAQVMFTSSILYKTGSK